MNNFVDNDEKKIPKTVVNANIFNGVILFVAVFSQLAMIKIINETQTELAALTYVIFALIVILSGLNFKLQNLKWLNIINSVIAILFAINLYVFLFLIIGFWLLRGHSERSEAILLFFIITGLLRRSTPRNGNVSEYFQDFSLRSELWKSGHCEKIAKFLWQFSLSQ